MNEGPPDWGDIPPPDMDSYGTSAPAAGGNGQGGKSPHRSNKPPSMTPEQLADASADFYTWLESADTLKQLTMLLPDHVDAKVFIATAKTAVLMKPKMLRESLRQSLLIAIMKAAAMGLLPDGKQGALVERYDNDAKDYMVAFQPMVWGIAKLGRETGAIKTIRAVLVFRGETFRILAGEEDRIEHEVDPDIVEEAYGALNGGRDQYGNPVAKATDFLARVRAAYCFLTAPDGTVIRRWMTHQRILSLYESTKATRGPWNGRFIDEMILKGVILFTSKWINLDPTTAEAKRFQSALMSDLAIDFDSRSHQIAAPANQDRPQQAVLPPPTDKLGSLEDAIAAGMTEKAVNGREKVAATGEGAPTTGHDRANTAKGGDRASPPSPPKVQEQQRTAGVAQNGRPNTERQGAPPGDDVPFIDKVTVALQIDGGVGNRWMGRLKAATLACPTMDDLALIKIIPSVTAAFKHAPAHIRSEMDAMFREAAMRLAVVDEEDPGPNDGWPGPKVGEAA